MVYVSCCNAQINLIVDTMTCTCIVMHLSIGQLSSCNLFTQHVSYLLWRDTTSEMWTQHVMTHKYRGCIVVLSINKSVEPNEEQKVLAGDLDQEFTVKN